MATSLPPVSAKLIADAEQFIAEFRRAERAAAQGTSKVAAEVDKMAKSIGKKFELADVGKDIMKGLGIGSGFGVINLVIDQAVALWREAEQEARDYKEVVDSITKSMRDFSKATREAQIAGMLDPADQLKARKEQLAALLSKAQDASGRVAELNADIAKLRNVNGYVISGSASDPLQGKYGYGEQARNTAERLSGLAVAEGDKHIKLLEERRALLAEIKELEAKIAKGTIDGAEKAKKAEASLSESATKSLKKEEDARKLITDAIAKQDAELAKLASKYAEMADPALSFRKQLEEVDLVLRAGSISASQAAAAIEEIHNAMAKAVNGDVFKKMQDEVFGPADDDMKEKAQAASSAARELGWAFQSGFEDAAIAGEGLSSVLDGLFDDLKRIALRKGITEPLGNWFGSLISGGTPGKVGGILGGIGKIFGFAGGGRPPVGRPSLIGEDGPELWVPDQAGTVVPNHAMVGGSSSKNFFIDARGADRTGLQQLYSYIRSVDGSIEERAVAANFAAGRRTLARA